MLFQKLGQYFSHSFFVVLLRTLHKRTIKVLNLEDLLAFKLRELQILILVFQNTLKDFAWTFWIDIHQRVLIFNLIQDAFLERLQRTSYLVQEPFQINFFEVSCESCIVMAQMRNQSIKLPRVNELMLADFLFVLVFAAALSADSSHPCAWVLATVLMHNAIMGITKCEYIILLHPIYY